MASAGALWGAEATISLGSGDEAQEAAAGTLPQLDQHFTTFEENRLLSLGRWLLPISPSMKLRPLTGTLTAMVTPFRRGAVAYDELRRFT